MRQGKWGVSCPTPIDRDASGAVTKWCDYKPSKDTKNEQSEVTESEKPTYSTKDPNESKRIQWQHSQEMAIRWIEAGIKVDSVNKENFEIKLVDKFTRHFFDDIENALDNKKDIDF